MIFCKSLNFAFYPGTRKEFPYVFVADDAFPLRFNIVKPYSNFNLDINKFIANYRTSQARRIIENTFGILTARFRIFYRLINAKEGHAESYTKATRALRNYLMLGRNQGSDQYCPSVFADVDLGGQWREPSGDG